MRFFVFIVAILNVIYGQTNNDTCPGEYEGTPPDRVSPIPPLQDYINALQTLNISDVFTDIYKLIEKNNECWPADKLDGKRLYGGLFVRLSWHCSGSFRNTDGVGGCAGGRQRFPPESSWPDNTNLDKARALLHPIKEKYGDKLSWGDLMIFAGTASIKYMGGPITSVCGGRIDDFDGEKSRPLNDSTGCPDEGNCPPPYGTSTIGLIYVNPEGVNGDPNPVASAARIRDIFGRMGFNNSETVALIGGGHAFGKSHGACPLGAGPSPIEDPLNPWPGLCGNGKGVNTYTSGLEGQWTTNPFKWDNEYFTQLIDDDYQLIKGAGDKWQWKNTRNGNMMFTTDIALMNDGTYYGLVQDYAKSLDTLSAAFGPAWKKLTESGSGWVDTNYRVCVNGTDLPDP